MSPFRRAAPARHARPHPPVRRAVTRSAVGGLLIAGVTGALLAPTVSSDPGSRATATVLLAGSAASSSLTPGSAPHELSEPGLLPDRAPAVQVARATRSRPVAARRIPAPPRAIAGPAIGWVRPVTAAVNSPYGQRWGRPHRGIDFGASYGSPIVAIGDGVVVGVGYQAEEGGYGEITLIRHTGGVVSAYAHQSRIVVRVGEHVLAGQLVGYVGSTGHVTGPHLHFEIRTSLHGGQVNPRTWLRAHGVIV